MPEDFWFFRGSIVWSVCSASFHSRKHGWYLSRIDLVTDGLLPEGLIVWVTSKIQCMCVRPSDPDIIILDPLWDRQNADMRRETLQNGIQKGSKAWHFEHFSWNLNSSSCESIIADVLTSVSTQEALRATLPCRSYLVLNSNWNDWREQWNALRKDTFSTVGTVMMGLWFVIGLLNTTVFPSDPSVQSDLSKRSLSL